MLNLVSTLHFSDHLDTEQIQYGIKDHGLVPFGHWYPYNERHQVDHTTICASYLEAGIIKEL